ncbi:Fe-S cluster assembly sulfur transfer protein SufU [Tannockella kyphosi]|uniref:Fe-S cluster assembly sulfur transfer protein SufU n=1 Tax=Tannockella kyphosi TaxID=2899121 RepID=UPI0020128DA9|nr:SUF system NifU family Fe-S cluster assembly protein [Tannockella kyphosi]
MPSLDSTLLRQIIMDHYENPRNHQLVDDQRYLSVNMDSSTCIDNIDIQAYIENKTIKDIRFDGEACAICTASTSIMSELLIGKTIDNAKVIIENFMNMIYEREYDAELLEEGIAFMNTHKQANRIKCATLGWTGVTQILESSQEG